MRPLHHRQLLWVLLLALPVVLVLGLLSGAVFVTPGAFIATLGDWLAGGQSRDGLILFSIRLPRLILAALLGLVLAGAGAAMQGLFRNPLADPSLIGVASGASAGAGVVVVFGGAFLSAGWLGMPLVAAGAFAGGFLAVRRGPRYRRCCGPASPSAPWPGPSTVCSVFSPTTTCCAASACGRWAASKGPAGSGWPSSRWRRC